MGPVFTLSCVLSDDVEMDIGRCFVVLVFFFGNINRIIQCGLAYFLGELISIKTTFGCVEIASQRRFLFVANSSDLEMFFANCTIAGYFRVVRE